MTDYIVESKVTKRTVFESRVEENNENSLERPKVSYLNLEQKLEKKLDDASGIINPILE